MNKLSIVMSITEGKKLKTKYVLWTNNITIRKQAVYRSAEWKKDQKTLELELQGQRVAPYTA